ncbi:5-hydroxytryptamine receptor 3A [Chanos chanos]|uniref:5-hydroxytryptamine receptor 3A n=1 Tax=Chanos chanos TaxID=29144 RepID=A0A6J2VGH5_CHACN|nr:5-hydroxytryptamine receptor 3A-like [Chanos chanos]
MDEVFSERVCSYQDVLNFLNLTRNNERYTVIRPVLDWTRPTLVNMDMHLCAILNVTWKNELISWDPKDFCGITRVTVPRDLLWIPDLYIFESVEKDDEYVNPYLSLSYDGNVTLDEDFKLIINCKMDVHKFPFDTQSCDISFSSCCHTVNELRFLPISNSTKVTRTSKEILLSQGEWEFLNMSVRTHNLSFHEHGDWNIVQYTVSIRRKPLLHIINFQLPILFFLILDFASFFIMDSRSDKLSFKMTLLLAISVLLLILRDILPSKSNKTPLIATYVIVIFALMLLSVLETILVNYLKDMDSARQEFITESAPGSDSPCTKRLSAAHLQSCETEKNKRTPSDVFIPSSGGNSPSGSPTVVELHTREKVTESQWLCLILEELQKLRQSLSPCSAAMAGKRPYWTQVADYVDRAFYVIYLLSALLFLFILSLEWKN